MNMVNTGHKKTFRNGEKSVLKMRGSRQKKQEISIVNGIKFKKKQK
jgi:hypothetical protein